MFCLDKHIFVATKVSLSRQNFYGDKNMFVPRRKNKRSFVATSILLSRQKTCFVATKMILVAASANNTIHAV